MKRSILSSLALLVGALFFLFPDVSAQVVVNNTSYSPQNNPPFTVTLSGTVPPCGATTGSLTLSMLTSSMPAGTVYTITGKSSIGNTFNQSNTVVTATNGQLISQNYSGLAGSVSGVLYTFTITTPKIPPAQNDSSYVAVITAYVYSTKTFSAVVNPVNPKCPVPPNKGSASVTVISGTAPYTYTWSNVSPNPGNVPNVNSLNPGNYSVYVKDAFGCDTTMPFSITIRNPTVTLSVNPNPICDPVFPINITWNAIAEAGWVPHAAPGAFSWDGGVTWTSASSSNSSFTMFGVNTYGVKTKSVIFRDTAGCIANATLNVPVDTRPVFTATASPTSVCPGATSVVTANLTSCSSAGASCEFSFDGGLTYLSPNSNVYTTPAINRDTTIIVRVQNTSGCFRDRTVSIDTAGRPRLNITVPTICPNAPYTINANCTSNCSGVELNFNNNGFIAGSPQSYTQPTAPTVGVTTTFPLSARGLNGCRLDTTVTVNVYNNTLAITKPADTTLCANNNGSTVTLTATGFQPATSLTWSTNPGGSYGDGSTANPLVVSSPTAGTITYTVTGTDTHGCYPRTATQSLVAKPQPVVTVSGPAVHCEGTTSSLNAAGASTYNWYNVTYTTLLSSPGSTYNVTPTVATTYNVIGTDTRGCIDTATYVLPFKNRPSGTAAGSPTTVCSGNTSTITITPNMPFTPNASGGYSFADGIPGTYGTNPVYTAGPFTTTSTVNTKIKDIDGCESLTIPVTITVLPFTFSATAVNPSCSYSTNGSILINNLSGGTSPNANYSINGGASVAFTTSATVSNLAAGTYVVTVSDNSSPACSNTTSVPVAVPSPLVMTADTNHVICFGETSGSIPLNVTGGTLNFDYFRNDTLGTAIFANTTNRTPVYSNLGAGTYTLIVRDRNKCMDTATVTIRQPNSALVAPATSSVNSCFGASTGSISIPSASTGGWGGYVYTKTTAPTQTLTIPASLTNLSAGTYNFNVTDSKGCVVTFSQAVIDNGRIYPRVTTVQSDCGVNGEIHYAQAVGGTSPYTYSLNAGGPFGTLPADETNLLVNTTRTLYVLDALNCPVDTTVTVLNIPRGIPIISITPPICPGESNGTITVDSTHVKGLSGGPFDFKLYTDASPMVSSGSYTNIASTASITFASLASGNYIMTMSDQTCTDYVVDSFRVYTSPTNYTVVKAPYAGLNPDYAEMVVPVTPGFTASSISLASDVHESTGSVIIYNYKGGTPLVQAGRTQYQMSLDNDISFAYVPLRDTLGSNTYVAFNNLAPGPHTIYIKDMNGCSDTIYVQVPGKFFIPNLITPNGDNANDYFEVVSLPDNTELRLYNRWGDRVFESSNYDNKYDFKGLADGVYYYDLQFMTGTHFKGWVQVIR